MIGFDSVAVGENKQNQITGVFLPLGKETVELVKLTQLRKQINKVYEMKNELGLMMLDDEDMIKMRNGMDYILTRLYQKYNQLASNYEKEYLRKWLYLVEDAASCVDRFNGRMSLPADKRARVGEMTVEQTDHHMRDWTRKKIDETFYNLLKQ